MDKLQAIRLLFEVLVPYEWEMILDEKMFNLKINKFPNVYGIYTRFFGTVHGVLTNMAGYEYAIAIEPCPNGVDPVEINVKIL